MSVTKHIAVAALAGVVGCAPIQSTTSSLETVVSTDTVVTEPQSSFMTAKVDVTPAGCTVRVSQSGSCEEKRVETVRVEKKTVRTAKRSVLIFEIAAAGLGLGLGAGIALDASNVADEDDPLQSNPVTPDQARAIGFAVLGLGVVAAAAAGIDLMRARDEVGGAETIQRDVEGESKIIACNESTVSNQDVGLVIRGRYVPIGTLDGNGSLQVGWDAIPADMIDMPDWPERATVAVGPRGEIQSLVEGGGKLTGEAVGQMSLEHARAAAAERAWQAALQADTVDAFRAYAAQFPEAHADDVGAEIDKRDVEGAKRRKAEALAAMWALYDKHVAAGSLLQAGGTLVDIGALAPDDPRLEQARADLLEAKLARADELVGKGRALIRAKDYAGAMKVLADAESFVPDHPGVLKYRPRAKAKEVKRLLKEAKTLTRKGDYAAATELIERAAVLDPDGRGVERARKDVEKRAGAAAANAARDEARRKAAAAERAEKEAAKSAKDAERAERKEKALERKRSDHKLEYRVDDTYADDNLTTKMRYPQECTAKPRTKRVSKDKVGTVLHLVRTVEVKCGDFAITLVKDRTELTVECENRTCAECTETAEWILEPAVAQMRRDGKKLKKVKSCR